ncbi:MAG TPA: trypsin-like peptidase domain-containing protein [Steroidobacteraceae bacterium]|nr:trypsin-like peptidase domain-containing protein [Steroidobacteraceae bacterium]
MAAVRTDGAAATAHAGDEPSTAVENSVVKVFSTLRSPDPFRPWSKQSPREVSGSGVVIDGKRILTNAHVVLYAGQIQVQPSREGNKIPASIVAIAPGIDLALLKLEDESFFKNHAPVIRAEKLPDIKDTVLAYGFPTGGTSLSITKGIVSRIEFAAYNYPTSGLRIQVDAPINPGNSGGPAFVGDKMVGITFAGLLLSQSIGYVIPNDEIELFLRDVADGHYDGKLAMFDELQTLDNAALRAYLKLDKDVQGFVVRTPYHNAPDYPLREWDVVTHVGNVPVDNEGMVQASRTLRVNFQYLIPTVAKNDKLPLTIVRAGKTLQVQLPLERERPLLIPDLNGDYPPYFIYGPVVFSVATAQFLTFLNNNAGALNSYSFNRNPLVTRRGDAPDAQKEELVVVAAPFFPHKLVNGYGTRFGSVLQSVNGTPVRSLRHLVALLRDLKDEFVVFHFDQKVGETVVFARSEVLAATEEILTDNGVRAQGSPDMLEVWQGRR